MGTNYYYHENVCPHCEGSEKILHIGKSSGGWCFGLHVIPEEGINSLEDWKQRWKTEGSKILDEYNREIDFDLMLDTIMDRGSHRSMKDIDFDEYPWGNYTDLNNFLDKNHAELGPNNLLRHRIGRFCVGHGEGTWDLMSGEFS